MNTENKTIEQKAVKTEKTAKQIIKAIEIMKREADELLTEIIIRKIQKILKEREGSCILINIKYNERILELVALSEFSNIITFDVYEFCSRDMHTYLSLKLDSLEKENVSVEYEYEEDEDNEIKYVWIKITLKHSPQP